jgi:hypothetical protein
MARTPSQLERRTKRQRRDTSEDATRFYNADLIATHHEVSMTKVLDWSDETNTDLTDLDVVARIEHVDREFFLEDLRNGTTFSAQ